MTITDAELVRALAYTGVLILAGCGSVAWWGVRTIVRHFGTLRDIVDAFKSEMTREIRGLDRRITRVEAVLRLPTPSDGVDNPPYVGPERRASD
jgi:hypothetical protein